ncbi:MAG: hypothetical protein R2940_15405 [Syntrophotaleaceae bacterium]
MKSKTFFLVFILILTCFNCHASDYKIDFVEAKGFDTKFYFSTNMPNELVEVILTGYNGKLTISKGAEFRGSFWTDSNGRLIADTYEITNGSMRACGGFISTSKQFTMIIEAFPNGETVRSNLVFQQKKKKEFTLFK